MLQHLFLTSYQWNERQFVFQHIARVLSQRGDRVLYTSVENSFPRALVHANDRSRIYRWLRGKRGLQEADRNILEYIPIPLWHAGNKFPRLYEAQVRTVATLAINAARRTGFEAQVVWSASAYGYGLRSVFPRAKIIYYVLDDNRVFPKTNPRKVDDADRAMATASDLLVVVSEALRQRFLSYHGAPPLLVYNRVQEALLAITENDIVPLSEFVRLPRPILGFLGALRGYIDYELLRRIAEGFPQATLALVGPIIDRKGYGLLKNLPNVYFYGEVSYEDVPRAIQAFDVCLLPFSFNNITLAADPGKMYEYLALGKPIVATWINDDMDRYRDIVYLVRNEVGYRDRFLHTISEALQCDRATLKRRTKVFMKEYTWIYAVEQIMGELNL